MLSGARGHHQRPPGSWPRHLRKLHYPQFPSQKLIVTSQYDLLIQPEPGKLLRAIVLLTLAAETDFGRHSKEDKLRWVDEAAVLHSQFQYVTSADEEAIVYIAEKIESTKQHVEDTFAAYQHELVDAANKPASVLVEGPEQYAPHTSGIVAEAPGSDKVVGTSETEAGGSQEY